ncbi:MAG: GNAT family N-acetyltransferase [Phycisphaerales bacterium]|nr:GNAT family N-acetyltransferase [Phycisphaerales bacterium]
MPTVIQAHHIPSTLWLSAAERLVNSPGERAAAKRLVANAKAHNIDLNHLWGVLGRTPTGDPMVRQVCLAVIGSGKTAMLFLSSPRPNPVLGTSETQIREIGAAIREALDQLRVVAPGRVTLAQTLLETKQTWGAEACESAGMTFVGRLEYLKRPLTPADAEIPAQEWPESIRVRSIGDPMDFSASGDGTQLAAALDASYIDTLDCPELCGKRSTRDVIESHQSAGVFDPNHWYLIEQDHAPVGCCLLSPSPELQTIELVYIGLGPTARGLGLGRMLLNHAIRNARSLGASELSCAVDTRNTPALRIYESMGFTAFDARLGYIASV